MKTVFAFDIGGTAVKFGLVAEGGRLLKQGEVPFERDLPFTALGERLARLYEDVMAGAPADALAVAMPGFASPDSGIVVDGGGNVPALRDGSIAGALEQRLSLPVWFANDGVAAALGEIRYGAGRALSRFVLITIGTGVGGAVVLDGKPVIGPDGHPPELGAIVVGLDDAGRPLSLEARSSAPAMLQAHAARMGTSTVSVRTLFALAEAGDAEADATIDAACRGIAQAAGALTNTLMLDAIVLGGGVSGAGEALARRIRVLLPAYVWPALVAKVEIRIAELGNTAGLLGVASLAFEGLSEPANDRSVRQVAKS
ncbi:ROK family protein [Bosea vestrisii]|uniref:ROK family protein n=1 Tax=Bosea vestrisii TaxID=151416 RepID=UPI0024DFABD0|nr:ROK family protein [Bosea vestrisii]WID98475.1 ROK family protein [Bosea vestrisii]